MISATRFTTGARISTASDKEPLPDYLARGLKVVFVGFNPGVRSGELGHHYAGYTNLFWRLLSDAGFTDHQLEPEDDWTLLSCGYGLTNIVPRTTPGSADLEWAELVEGGRELRQKVGRYRPLIVALLGKDVYRAYAGLKKSARVDWGRQEEQQVPGVVDFLAPNPSTRSTIRYEKRLALFGELFRLVESRKEKTDDNGG